jgi:glycine cleavage system H protein
MAFQTPENLKFLHSHEWARVEGEEVVIGITDYAQDSLGDVVYLELPEVGTTLAAGELFGAIESVKAASDLFMPVGGEIIAVNSDLINDQSAINTDPYGQGWMLRIAPVEGGEDKLLDAAAYKEYVDSIAH